jgi:hypothetical protein
MEKIPTERGQSPMKQMKQERPPGEISLTHLLDSIRVVLLGD